MSLLLLLDQPFPGFRSAIWWWLRGGLTAQTVHTADLSATLADATLSATAILAIKGTLTQTLDDATLAATGTLAIKGTLSQTLSDATLAATATLAIKGALSNTLGDASLSATGVLPITASLGSTLADVTLSATATLRDTGTAADTLADITLSATATLAIKGTLSGTLGDVTLSATATLPAEQTFGFRSALWRWVGGLAAPAETTTTPEVAAAPLGGRLPRRRKRRLVGGDAALYLPGLWLYAEGEISEPPEGEFAARFDPQLFLRGAGASGVAGRAELPSPVLSLAADLFIAPCGDARVEFEPVLRSLGRHDHFNDAELTLLPLLLELT